MEKKKVFFIAVTDEPESNNRKYSDFIYELCYQLIIDNNELNEQIDFQNPGRHDMSFEPNIKKSLFENLENSGAFIVLLDTLDKGYNPNVWFELGVISTADIPVLFIAQKDTIIPFDVHEVKVIRIPERFMRAADLENRDEIKNTFVFSTIKSNRSLQNEYFKFSSLFTKTLKASLAAGSPFTHWYDLISIEGLGYRSLSDFFKHSGIDELLRNPDVHAEYISGEKNAFKALTHAVNEAVESVRTTRFGDQSIVSQAEGEHKEVFSAHQEFMDALYEASKRDSIKLFDRIVCNNNPNKWDDISQVLMNCSEKLRLFVRKYNYNINFELVVIDERVAFIHFYQTSQSGDKDESFKSEGERARHDSQTQRIKSTLKITGKSTCIELAKIFDRLHHRDFDRSNPKELSRTLLGVESLGELSTDEIKAGYFTPKPISPSLGGAEAIRTATNNTKDQLVTALNSWNISGQDKINMIIGLHLVHSISLDCAKVFTAEEARLFNNTIEKYHISKITPLEIRDDT